MVIKISHSVLLFQDIHFAQSHFGITSLSTKLNSHSSNMAEAFNYRACNDNPILCTDSYKVSSDAHAAACGIAFAQGFWCAFSLDPSFHSSKEYIEFNA